MHKTKNNNTYHIHKPAQWESPQNEKAASQELRYVSRVEQIGQPGWCAAVHTLTRQTTNPDVVADCSCARHQASHQASRQASHQANRQAKRQAITTCNTTNTHLDNNIMYNSINALQVSAARCNQCTGGDVHEVSESVAEETGVVSGEKLPFIIGIPCGTRMRLSYNFLSVAWSSTQQPTSSRLQTVHRWRTRDAHGSQQHRRIYHNHPNDGKHDSL